MEAPRDAAERERLRRALYREGATDADRDRYARTVPAAPAAEEDAPPGARWRLPAVPVAVLAAAAVAVLAWPVVAGTSPAAITAADPLPVASRAPTTSTPPVDASLTGITYTDAGVVQAFHGIGTTTVRLDGDVMPDDGGRLSVVLSPSETALIGWEVRRSVPAEGAADQLIAARSATEGRGVAVPIVFPYDGRPPTTVAVRAPGGVAWALVVTSLRGATAR